MVFQDERGATMSLRHLDRIKQRLPPLDPPPESHVDWTMAEGVYGLAFPTDFKQFIATYGNVEWCDLFRPVYPRTESRKACEQSRASVLQTLDAMYAARLWDRDGNLVNIPPYPASGGLLPCVIDSNSDVLCWRTDGPPDGWTLAYFQEGNVFFYPCDVTQLICDWIERIPPATEVWGDPTQRPFEIRH
jgi:hypothetical protein